jgi:hypothetical protein
MKAKLDEQLTDAQVRRAHARHPEAPDRAMISADDELHDARDAPGEDQPRDQPSPPPEVAVAARPGQRQLQQQRRNDKRSVA